MAAWEDRCARSDVTIDGDASDQHALRFALYHLNSAANPADEHVSIGARALTGDDYRGHEFWDTEIFPIAVLLSDRAGGRAVTPDVSLPHFGRRACDAGATILLEKARFSESWAQPEAEGRRHTRTVIGPDERLLPLGGHHLEARQP